MILEVECMFYTWHLNTLNFIIKCGKWFILIFFKTIIYIQILLNLSSTMQISIIINIESVVY